MNRILLACLLALTAVAATVPARAASIIYLAPNVMDRSVGETFSTDLWMNFSVATNGIGSLAIQYDSTLLDASFSYDPGFSVDMTYAPDLSTAGTIGNIGFYDVGGISGLHRIGTLTLTALAAGTTAVSLVEESAFLTANLAADAIAVGYSGADVRIAAVPVPAAFWLLGSGLGLLGLWRRPRRN